MIWLLAWNFLFAQSVVRDKKLNSQVQELGQFNLDSAKKLFIERSKLVYAQFDANFDPYRGLNSIPLECQPSSFPKEIVSENAKDYHHLLSVMSSKDKMIGDCARPKNLLKVQYLLLFCKDSNTAYIVKTFYDSKKSWIQAPAAICPNLLEKKVIN